MNAPIVYVLALQTVAVLAGIAFFYFRNRKKINKALPPDLGSLPVRPRLAILIVILAVLGFCQNFFF